jgi:hypothetical protein
VPFQPWAREEFRQRRQRLSIDDPAARCKPYGVPAINTYPAPFKILHTPQLMVRRPDFGHLEIHVTIDDPKAYTKPFTFTQRQEGLIDSELLEHFCTDNEKFGSQLR